MHFSVKSRPDPLYEPSASWRSKSRKVYRRPSRTPNDVEQFVPVRIHVECGSEQATSSTIQPSPFFVGAWNRGCDRLEGEFGYPGDDRFRKIVARLVTRAVERSSARFFSIAHERVERSDFWNLDADLVALPAKAEEEIKIQFVGAHGRLGRVGIKQQERES